MSVFICFCPSVSSLELLKFFSELNRLDLQLSEMALKQDYLLGTLPLYGKEFIIDFHLNIPVTAKHHIMNIIQFRPADTTYGERIPALFQRDLSQRDLRLEFRTSLNSDKDHKYDYAVNSKMLNTWISIRIQQLNNSDSGTYDYSIFIDNSLVHTKTNKKARNYYDVEIYASSPKDKPHDGLIRNFTVYRK